jgi:hypothetical protein
MTVWYIARGAGLAALVLLTVSTTLGALTSRRFTPSARYVVQYLHRAFAGLGLATLGLHVGAILADSFAHVGWLGALVPLTSEYRPLAVALGSLAAYVLVAVSALGLARGRIASSAGGARAWRWLHGLAYLGWGAAMLHGFTAGTDSSVPWVRTLYVLSLVAVVGSGFARLTQVGLVRAQGALR